VTRNTSIGSEETSFAKHTPRRKIAFILIVPQYLKIILLDDVVTPQSVNPAYRLGKSVLIRVGVPAKGDLRGAANTVTGYLSEVVVGNYPVHCVEARILNTLPNAKAIQT
jgi:hypothetical protein